LKLRAELYEAIRNVSAVNTFSFEKLERLPYLTGCIKEGIRLSYGLSGRITRVFNEPLIYKDWTIPPKTAVSMSITDVSFDEAIFESPRQYKPERWFAGAPKPADGSSLENYFVPFSKGSRMCLGIK
jgi:cytochrome P450